MARLLRRLPLKNSKITAWLAGCVLLCAVAPRIEAQQAAPERLSQMVAYEVQTIHDAERSGMEPLKLGRLWAQLASDYEDEMQVARSEDAYNHALRLFDAASAKVDYAIVLDNLGSLYLMSGNFAEAERCRIRSLAVREALGDKLQIARGKAHLAEVELGRRKYKEAERDSREAYSEMVAVKDPDVSDMVSALVTLIYSECGHNCLDALGHARAASSLAQGAFAADSLPVGQTHLALGYAEWRMGMKEGPDEEMREGIRIMKERTSSTHPYVLSALEQYRAYLESAHRTPEAREIAQELTRIEGARLTQCQTCTVSVYGLR